MPRYFAAGLEIESELPLPGLVPGGADGVSPDVVVRWGEAPAALPDAVERGANWELGPGAVLVSIPELARFWVRRAGEVVVAPAPGADAGDLAIFAAGPMLGLLLHLRGRIALQASAVAVGGGAALLCGHAAAGKSTFAAALGRRGHPMICDDLCAIELDGAAGPCALADTAMLQLWAEPIDRLGLARGPPVRAALQKHHVRAPAGAIAAAPVRAIYVLEEAGPSEIPGIVRPNVVDLAILVRRSAFRPNLVRALGQQSAYLAAAARLALGAGVFTFTRAFGFERMDGVLDELEAHWAEIGLASGKAA